MGGGTTLSAVSGGAVPYWFGGALVAIVVMSYVFFGGMRGTAWVNTVQTVLFLSFGAIAIVVIGYGMGGFGPAITGMRETPGLSALLTRERISEKFFLSYMFIPLSSIAFPHISIFCLTAKKMGQFKRTVILYPICLLLIWLPCVYLGVVANRATDVRAIAEKIEARNTLLLRGAYMSPEERLETRRKMAADDVIIELLKQYAPLWLAGLLGAGIMAAVMASDSQILALSTLFTEDLFAFYEGRARFGEAAQVHTGRAFVIILTVIAYLIALRAPQSIFDLAVQYAFSGFAALSVLLFAALFWKSSTKWGALAVTLFTIASVAGVAAFQALVPAPLGPPKVIWSVGGWEVLSRTAGGTAVFGYMPVVPMVLIAALLMVVVSLMTPKPSQETIARYFRTHGTRAPSEAK
jgi:SSS family solute:Na+ symporter